MTLEDEDQEVKPSEFVIASLDGTYDFIGELQARYYDYYIEKGPGVSWINIVTLPTKLRTTLEKLKAQTCRKRVPGLPPALCCAIHNGLGEILSHPEIRNLRQLKTDLDKRKQLGTPKEEFVYEYFRSKFKVGLEGGRQNVAIPDELKKRISGLSKDIGVAESDVGVIACMCLLANVREVPTPYRQFFRSKSEEFFEMVEMKYTAGLAMIERL